MAKAAILAASLVAGIAGVLVLRRVTDEEEEEGAAKLEEEGAVERS